MVVDLINAFHEAQLKLAKQMESGDCESFRMLDAKVEGTFNAILDCTPSTASEFAAIATFLLEAIAHHDTGIDGRILTRLGDLVQMMTSRI